MHSRGHIGVKKGQKLPISLKNNPQVQHICTCRYFLKRNSMVSHIFEKILYSTTLGSPRIQWGQKMPPCLSMYVYKHYFQSSAYDGSALLYSASFMFWTKHLHYIIFLWGHLHRSSREVVTWLFIVLNSNYQLKGFMIVRNWTTCYCENNSSNWTCFRYSDSSLDICYT